MEKEKIIQELQKHDSTILNFPDRGPWGSSSYRGNCSGWIHAFLVWKYQVTKMAELFAGSGTGYDVAKDMGIAYSGADLNPIPVRPGILQNDATRDMVPESFLDADFLLCTRHMVWKSKFPMQEACMQTRPGICPGPILDRCHGNNLCGRSMKSL
ncbi:MAG: hypothetical protein ACLTX3_08760 [Lachnospiraceae bacterium]